MPAVNDYKTDYSNDKNINTLQRGSFNDFGDGTPARQALVKQAPGEVFDVTVTNSSGEVKAIYNEANSIPINIETQINTFTVPTGNQFKAFRVLASGCNIAQYIIKKNGSVIASARSWWGDFNINLPLDSLNLVADDILSIHVINDGKTAETFESTIIGDQYV